MRGIVLPALVILAMSGVAGATTVECPAPPNGAVGDVVAGLTLTCGGYLFSNFNVVSAAGHASGGFPEMNLVHVRGSSLANFVAFHSADGPAVANADGSGSTFYVHTDVGVRPNQLEPGGGALSSFTQSVIPGGGNGQVPEPASMLLIGSGFIAVGTLRRRIRSGRAS